MVSTRAIWAIWRTIVDWLPVRYKGHKNGPNSHRLRVNSSLFSVSASQEDEISPVHGIYIYRPLPGLGEVRLGEMGLGEVGLGEMGLGETGLGKMGLGETGLGETGGHLFRTLLTASNFFLGISVH
jgi:hypothetical protein